MAESYQRGPQEKEKEKELNTHTHPPAPDTHLAPVGVQRTAPAANVAHALPGQEGRAAQVLENLVIGQADGLVQLVPDVFLTCVGFMDTDGHRGEARPVAGSPLCVALPHQAPFSLASHRPIPTTARPPAKDRGKLTPCSAIQSSSRSHRVQFHQAMLYDTVQTFM